MNRTKRNPKGMTLLELLLAAVLLAVAAVPIVNAAKRGMTTASVYQTRTRAFLLAQNKMETILTTATASYSQNFSCSSQNMGDGFLCTVTQSWRGLTSKGVTVQVGHDDNGNSVLDAGEVLVTMGTIVVKMGA